MKKRTHTPEDYIVFQNMDIKLQKWKVGDKAIVTHKVPGFTMGWDADWVTKMDSYIGEEITIDTIHDRFGFRADDGLSYYFPFMALQKVDPDNIVVGDYDGEILSDGSVQVGCTHVPYELLERIYKKATEKKNK